VYGVKIGPDSAAEEIAGETITYTLALTNTGDALQDSFDLIIGPHSWPVTFSPTPIGPLADGASAPVKAVVHIPSSATEGQVEVTPITAVSEADPSKSDTVTLTTTAHAGSADLAVVLSATPGPVEARAVITFTMVVSNAGPTKASYAALANLLPVGSEYLWDDANCTNFGRLVSCDLGKMAVGEVRTIRVRTKLGDLGLLVDQAWVSANQTDPNPGNNWVT
jgi:hypothetical protein